MTPKARKKSAAKVSEVEVVAMAMSLAVLNDSGKCSLPGQVVIDDYWRHALSAVDRRIWRNGARLFLRALRKP
jgi:hypothetical protein